MTSDENMKITIFGGTGKTGKYLIQEALKRGMDVTVFARVHTSFTHPQVRVIRGDLLDTERLAEAVCGSEAVLSALGPTSLKHPNDLPIARAIQAILSVMQQEGINRFIAISTGTAPAPNDRFDWMVNLPAWLIKVMMPAAYRDIIALAHSIRIAQLDWTMVRVATLTNRPASGKLNVGMYGHSKHTFTIPRADVAAFMLDQITSREFVRQAPGISSK